MTVPALRARVSAGRHIYRQLGPVRGTKTVVRYVLRAARRHARRWLVKRRPIRVTPAQVATALAGRSHIEALGQARRALPTVGRWLTMLDGAKDHATLIAVADEICAHRFDLLGSGPVDLGPEIDWLRDFKSGRQWPLDHISKIVVSYPDNSDIKVPWELSRGQHLPVLAAAHRVTGSSVYLEEIGRQLQSWIGANPVEFGPNWQCTMDVAIRAANWVATLAIWATSEAATAEPEPAWLPEVIASLLLHARFIRGHLESGPARGNHYLADVAGLMVVAAPFAASHEGRRWVHWAVAELTAEMDHQVRSDGCDHEASIPYHRLVAELFIIAADAADELAPGQLAPTVRGGIARMLAFTADYSRADGLAPQIGDADDGRFLPLGDYGTADHRSHRHLFGQAGAREQCASGSAAYPAGGYYFLRGGDLYAAVRCGDVGIYGRGCHAHNDALSFELCLGAIPLVIDPGSYLYTADPQSRNLFRSTGAHSTIQVDEREQNEIRLDRLFALADRAVPEALRWEPGATRTLFSGSHRGFSTQNDRCVHTRTFVLDGANAELLLEDELESDQAHTLTWRFALAPCEVEVNRGVIRARFSEAELDLLHDGLLPSVETGWVSSSYGVRAPAPVVCLRTSSTPGVVRKTLRLRARRIGG